jgi:hypothetical protein
MHFLRYCATCLLVISACTIEPVKITPDIGASSGSSGTGGNGSECDPCENANGTRLVHERSTVTSADGFKFVQLTGYFDLQLNERCQFLKAQDKTTRCLPINVAKVEPQFSDSTCKEQIASVAVNACGQTLPKYGMDVSIGGCDDYHLIWELGPSHAGSIFTLVNGTCVSDTKDPNLVYFQMGQFIPPTEFVEVQTENVH